MKKTYTTPAVTTSNAARETLTGLIKINRQESLQTSFVVAGFGL